jgi:mono/diheme cytochrome c family protein
MKTSLIFLMLFFGCIMLLQCATSQKITYNIPANYPEARRKQITELCDKGKELYKINCSDCHGVFTKGKDKVPNFTTHQLDNYSSRFIMRDPQNHAIAMQMSPDQLNNILLFLRFKNVSNPDTTKTGRRKN